MSVLSWRGPLGCRLMEPSLHKTLQVAEEYNQKAAPLPALFISLSKAIGLMPRGGEAMVTSHSEGGKPDVLG